jgi:hypothetical protein
VNAVNRKRCLVDGGGNMTSPTPRKSPRRATPALPVVGRALADTLVYLTRTLSPAALAVLRAEARATGVSEAVFAVRTLDMALRLAGRRGARK